MTEIYLYTHDKKLKQSHYLYDKLSLSPHHNKEHTKTNIGMDLAIGGQGYFVVSDLTHDDYIGLTRYGCFRMDSQGNIKLPSGHQLLAWKLDDSGNLPINKGQIESLSKVNIYNNSLISNPSATTHVDISLNLSSSECFPNDICTEFNETHIFNSSYWSASIKTDTFVKPIVTQIVQVNNNYC